MAKEKGNNSSKDTESKKTGNSCGFSIGCLVIIAAVSAVIFFLFIKPALEENGYTLEDIKERFLDFKDKARDTFEQTRDAYEDSKEKYQQAKENTEEVIQQGKETYDDAKEQYQDIKDKTQDVVEDLPELDHSSNEELSRNAPKLIKD